MNTTRLMSVTRRRHTPFVAGAIACALMSLSAVAQDARIPKQNVQFGDLNLKTEQGVKTLYARIVSASYDVCQSFGRDRYLNTDLLALHTCQRKALADAVQRIGNPALLALYHNEKWPPPRTTVLAADRPTK